MSSILLILSDPGMADRICRAVAADDATSLVVAGSVATLAEGREFVKRRVPDLIVVDLRVADGPVARWFDQFSSAGRARPRLVVIAWALHDPELLDSLRRGADGYSLASHAPEQLIDVIEEVLGGRSTMAPEIARRLQMHFAQHEASGTSLIDETDRQLLQWVSTGYGLDDIAQGMHTTPGHLGVQVRALYRKLQPHQGDQPGSPSRRAGPVERDNDRRVQPFGGCVSMKLWRANSLSVSFARFGWGARQSICGKRKSR